MQKIPSTICEKWAEDPPAMAVGEKEIMLAVVKMPRALAFVYGKRQVLLHLLAAAAADLAAPVTL